MQVAGVAKRKDGCNCFVQVARVAKRKGGCNCSVQVARPDGRWSEAAAIIFLIPPRCPLRPAPPPGPKDHFRGPPGSWLVDKHVLHLRPASGGRRNKRPSGSLQCIANGILDEDMISFTSLFGLVCSGAVAHQGLQREKRFTIQRDNTVCVCVCLCVCVC